MEILVYHLQIQSQDKKLSSRHSVVLGKTRVQRKAWPCNAYDTKGTPNQVTVGGLAFKAIRIYPESPRTAGGRTRLVKQQLRFRANDSDLVVLVGIN
jgi:hypothetical protein